MKPDPTTLDSLVRSINQHLARHDDESWHYTRLRLTVCPLEEIPGQKALWIETIETDTREGQRLLRELRIRVDAAVGHLSELPLIQIVICRMNEALFSLTDDATWQHRRPFITWIKKTELMEQGVRTACWYLAEEQIAEDEEAS